MSNAFATVFRKRVESAANRFHGLIYGYADTPKRLERVHAAIRESLLPLEPLPRAVETYEGNRAIDLEHARCHFRGTGRYATDADIEAAAEAEVEGRRPVHGFDSVPKFFPDENQHPYRIIDRVRLLAKLYTLVGVNPNEPLEPVWDEGERLVYRNATGPLLVWSIEDPALRESLDGKFWQENWPALVERLDGWVTEAEKWVINGPSGGVKTDVHVTVEQVARVVHLEPKSMSPYTKEWGQPVVPHKGSRPAQYSFSSIRPILETQFPETKDWSSIAGL
jgi:hypothetical protein